MNHQKGNIVLAVILGIVFVMIIAIATYFLLTQYYNVSLLAGSQPSQTNIACPADAKICPDGSSVGRIAPNCDFAPCPNTSNTNANSTGGWNTVSNAYLGSSLQYPNNFFDPGHEPKILVGNCDSATALDDCSQIADIEAENIPGGAADIHMPPWQNPSGYKLTINSAPYLLCQSAVAAADNSIDTSYYYLTVKNQQCTLINFDVTTENCENEPGNATQQQNYNNCVAKTSAEPTTIDQIVNTFQLSQ